MRSSGSGDGLAAGGEVDVGAGVGVGGRRVGVAAGVGVGGVVGVRNGVDVGRRVGPADGIDSDEASIMNAVGVLNAPDKERGVRVDVGAVTGVSVDVAVDSTEGAGVFVLVEGAHRWRCRGCTCR